MIELNHKIEILGGLLRFSLTLVILDFVLIFHFLLSWYYTKKKTGWTVNHASKTNSKCSIMVGIKNISKLVLTKGDSLNLRGLFNYEKDY